MPPRIRTQGDITWSHTVFAPKGAQTYTEYMNESSYPGSCSVFHVKHVPCSWDEYTGPPWDGRTFPPNGSLAYSWRNFVPHLQIAIPVPTSLNWGKLPSSTEASLIMLLAEWDETLALFTKKFWRQISYGSFTWGVLPFVSEVQAVLKALSNISKRIAELDYEDRYQSNYSVTRQNFRNFFPNSGIIELEGTLSCIYRLSGVADYSYLEIESMLDRLGFHPDLATLWDIVPLSFVIDWFLPIGSFLESLRRGGWVKTVYFSGWQTCKFSFEGVGYIVPYTVQPIALTPISLEGFKRAPLSTVLTVEPSIDESGLDFAKAFNTWYLLFRDKQGRFRRL